jgi:predicted HTH domain antitoxin
MGRTMKRTNIMLSDDQHKKLKRYAKREGRTLGGLVRDALDTVYKKRDKLEQRRQVALSAYSEGFISLGKLAEVLGLDPISARDFLKEQSIPIRSQDLKDLAQDVENA